MKVPAAKTSVKEIGKGTYVVAVRPREVRNDDNIRVVEVMAKHLKVPHSALKLFGGRKTPRKLLVLNDEYVKNPKLSNNGTPNAGKLEGNRPQSVNRPRLLS